jgi:uncharacterized SAM-binding protein YcdF (DUF218 family)
MNFIKGLASVLAAPLTTAFFLGAVAIAAGTRGWRRTRQWLLAVAAAIACLAAAVPVGDILLEPLEHTYPPLGESGALPAVDYVVVLGSGYTPHDGIPITAALDREGLVRVVEGVRLMRRLGSARLVLSGGPAKGQAPSAQGYLRLARELGVPDASLVVLDTALDSAQEARAIAARLGDARFLLVTSAWHMPRAMQEMNRAGAHAIPAPTGQLTGKPMHWGSWLPSADGLGRSERALHEYLGLAALTAHISD